MLEPLAGERRPAGGAAEQEPAGAAVAGGPDLIANPLKPEHRVVDEDRDHRHAMAGVGRAGGDEARDAPRLGDALLENLSVLGLAVIEQLIRVDRLVELAAVGIDAALLEERIHAEGPRLVGHDRNDVLADVLVLQERRHQRDHARGRGDLAAGTLLDEARVFLERGRLERRGLLRAGRHGAAEGRTTLPQILHLGRILRRPVERGLGDLVIRDRNPEPRAEGPQLLLVELLLLVGDVATLAHLAEAVALDRLGNHHGRLAVALHRRVVGRVDLLGIVAAAAQFLDLLVGEVRHHLGQLRITPEEVLADVTAGHHDILLILSVDDLVHPFDEFALFVLREQRIPLVAPDHLDDVPAGAAEDPFQLLDDLAVATHRAVEPLQVAVDDEHEVVELLAGRQRNRAERLRLVALAVADERPDVLLARVLDAAILQILVEPRLVDGHQRPEPHRHRGKLPELGHQPGMRVARKPAPLGQFTAEILQLLLAEPAFEERTGVDARRGMPLEIDLVARVVVAAATDEMVHRHFHERRRGGEGGDVAADALVFAISPHHHRHRIPADDALDPPLEFAVARERRLLVGRNRVDVGRGRGERDRHTQPVGLLLDGMQQIGGPIGAAAVDDIPQGVEPLGRLRGI